MDQTPVLFSMLPQTTLEEEGTKHVHVQLLSTSTIRAMVAVIVSASVEKIDPLITFNALPGGKIEKIFPMFPTGSQYAVQKKALTDEKIMLLWIEKILMPYVQSAPPNIHPVILLDSFKCQKMLSVMSAI
jgi:hypothetical protein